MSIAKITRDTPQYIMVRCKLGTFVKESSVNVTLAAMSNNPEVVESLIAAGAKVNYQYDRINDTLAHISIKKGNSKLLNILLR